MIVGFDLDGVLCDTYDAWLMCIATKYGIENIPGASDITEYYIENVINERLGVNLNRRDMWDTLDFTLRQTNIVRPFPEAKGVLSLVTMLGMPLIITARLPKYKECTAEWMGKWVGHYPVHHVQASEKPRLAKELGVDVFVEDKAETAIAMAEADIKSFLIDRPWNQGVNGNTGVVRLERLRDIVGHCWALKN